MKNLVLTLLLFVITFVYSQAQVKVTAVNGSAFFGIIVKNDQDSLILMDADRLQVYLTKKNIISIEEIKCTIENKKGVPVAGRIQTYDDNSIILKCDDGTIREFETSKVKITFDGVSSNTIANKNVKHYEYKDKYPFFGPTLLNPGGYNVYMGTYVSSKIAISCSIGYMGEKGSGIQGNLLYNIVKNSAVDFNIGVCAGSTRVLQQESFYYGNGVYTQNVQKYWTYAGVVVDLNYHGFFVQPGLSFGTGAFSSPQFLFQLGYVYRFNNK